MTLLIAGLAAFLGAHLFTLLRGPRAAVIGQIGLPAYKGLYALASIAGLALLIAGYGSYRAAGYVPVWNPPIWTTHLSFLILLPMFPLLLAAYLPGRIKAAVKHPMILAVKTWAFAHLLSNGDLGSMLLFGGFLVWAVVAFMNMRRRGEQNEMLVPLPPAKPINDLIAIGGGLALWAAFLFGGLHRWLVGVAALPGW
jgi:uncharacterized membrane protein